MNGKLIIENIYDEKTNKLKTVNEVALVELTTVTKPFYGDVVTVTNPEWGTREMLTPQIYFEASVILISGAVLVSQNYTVYQEWIFEPFVQNEKGRDER